MPARRAGREPSETQAKPAHARAAVGHTRHRRRRAAAALVVLPSLLTPAGPHAPGRSLPKMGSPSILRGRVEEFCAGKRLGTGTPLEYVVICDCFVYKCRDATQGFGRGRQANLAPRWRRRRGRRQRRASACRAGLVGGWGHLPSSDDLCWVLVPAHVVPMCCTFVGVSARVVQAPSQPPGTDQWHLLFRHARLAHPAHFKHCSYGSAAAAVAAAGDG